MPLAARRGVGDSGSADDARGGGEGGFGGQPQTRDVGPSSREGDDSSAGEGGEDSGSVSDGEVEDDNLVHSEVHAFAQILDGELCETPLEDPGDTPAPARAVRRRRVASEEFVRDGLGIRGQWPFLSGVGDWPNPSNPWEDIKEAWMPTKAALDLTKDDVGRLPEESPALEIDVDAFRVSVLTLSRFSSGSGAWCA